MKTASKHALRIKGGATLPGIAHLKVDYAYERYTVNETKPAEKGEPAKLVRIPALRIGYKSTSGKQLWAVKTQYAGVFLWTEHQRFSSYVITIEGADAVRAVARLQPDYDGILLDAEVKGRT